MASQPGPVMEFLGRMAYEFHLMKPLLPTYLHLLVSAIFPIYTAAHASLSRPSSAAPKKAKKKTKKGGSDDEAEDDDEESQKIESLTPSDALLFPLLAGGTLASLYFILKWLQDPAWLNWALGLYFSQIGLFFAMKFLKDMFSVARSFFFPSEYSGGGSRWKVDIERHRYISDNGAITTAPLPGLLRHIPLPGSISRLIWTLQSLLYTKARLHIHLHRLFTFKTSVDLLDLASLVLSCGIVYYHTFVSKPWFLTNFLGFSFCYGSLQFMTPTTAWTGTLVLGALFFYDIYFVFFTPMMVTVATKLDVPIKLLFPRPDGCVYPVGAPEGSELMEEYLRCVAKKRSMAMLGLGDIVVPGMMLAFALRFDLYLHYLRKGSPGKTPQHDTAAQDPTKPVYVNARGQWGERFWTNSRSRSEGIRATRFPKPYFYATIVGYLVGMITTVVVMQVAAHAQPALLYLVPGVLISLWGTALVKGEFRLLWQYSELPEDQDKKGGENKDGKDEKEKPTITDGAANGVAAKESPPDKKHDVEKAAKVKESTKHAKQKQDYRRLIYFAITLPKPTGDKTTDLVAATGNEESTSVGTAQGKKEDGAVSGESNAISTSRVTRSQDRTASGEPLGKRARRA
jgi:minor histocompatibility antigen H13